MKLIEIARTVKGNNTDLKEAISEAELMERKAKAFDFLEETATQHYDDICKGIELNFSRNDHTTLLEAVESAMSSPTEKPHD